MKIRKYTYHVNDKEKINAIECVILGKKIIRIIRIGILPKSLDNNQKIRIINKSTLFHVRILRFAFGWRNIRNEKS